MILGGGKERKISRGITFEIHEVEGRLLLQYAGNLKWRAMQVREGKWAHYFRSYEKNSDFICKW